MNRCKKAWAFLCITGSFLFSSAAALSDGYIIYGTYDGTSTVLIDTTGSEVYTWDHTSKNGYSVYLLENGNVLRTAQVEGNVKYPSGAMPLQGIIEEVDAAGNVVWNYQLANDSLITHHDMKIMPNGHIIACAFEFKSKEQMVEVGVDTALLKGGGGGFGFGSSKGLLAEMIFELDPHAQGGPQIVWEWHICDHVIPKEQASQHPELFNGSLGPLSSQQWVHMNGIDYCAKTDLIAFTSRLFSEIYVIDHSTTTQEAASHAGGAHGKGGDLLYRWGRNANFMGNGDTIIRTLHCPTWIPDGYPGAGDLLFFHNNAALVSMMGSNGVSQVIQITPPRTSDGKFIHTAGEPFGPAQPTWKYAPDSCMFSGYMSSAFRLKNGNTLVHESQEARVREITPDGDIVWMDTLSSGSGGGMMMDGPAKIMYYPGDYIGIEKLLGRELKSADKKGKTVYGQQRLADIRVGMDRTIEISAASGSLATIYTVRGERVASLPITSGRVSLSPRHLPSGACIVQISSSGKCVSKRVINVR